MSTPRALINPFRTRKITDSRLANFSETVVKRLSSLDNAADYSLFINRLKPAVDAFKATLVGVDTSVSGSQSNTAQRAAFIKQFKTTMSEKEGAIAHGLGGFASAGYHAFYPHGVTEYSRATQERIPDLIGRVDQEAALHAAAFDTSLATLLQSFKPGWDALADEVNGAVVSVGEKRASSSANRTAVEDILFDILHSVAGKSNTEQQVKTLFDFNLLYAKKRGKKTTGTAPGIGTTLPANGLTKEAISNGQDNHNGENHSSTGSEAK